LLGESNFEAVRDQLDNLRFMDAAKVLEENAGNCDDPTDGAPAGGADSKQPEKHAQIAGDL
jgi:hypothetical protein